jgi:hypothetical protein
VVGKEVDKYAFAVGGCDDIPSAEMHSSKTEEADAESVYQPLWIDPDIVTGYNIMGF